jgi:hypothetical protein
LESIKLYVTSGETLNSGTLNGGTTVQFQVPMEHIGLNSDSNIKGGSEKRENLKLTMRFRPAVKFLLHTQYAHGFVTLKRLVRL